MRLELLRRLASADLAMLTHATGAQCPVLVRQASAGVCLVSWSPPDGAYKRRESVSVRGEALHFKGEITLRVFAETRPDTLDSRGAVLFVGGDWLAPHLYTVERSDGQAVTQAQWRMCNQLVREVYEAVQVDLPILRAAVERLRDEARVLEVEAKMEALSAEHDALKEKLQMPRPW